MLATASAGGHEVFDMRFNPYQAYGLPDNPPIPGQASDENDAVYTLTSCGTRHIKFWVLLRSQDETSDFPDVMKWYLEGNSVNYATKTAVQDITSFDFVDDSKELTIVNALTNELEVIDGSTERSHSRIIAGTSDGDIFVFKQPEVKLQYSKGSRPKPWWHSESNIDQDPGVMKKRLWDR